MKEVMPMSEETAGLKTFTTWVIEKNLKRIRLLSAASGRPIYEIVNDALEIGLPHHRVVIDDGDTAPQRRAKAVE